MSNPSRDTVISVILLMFCGFLIWAGFLIRDPQFGALPPAAWPKGVTYVLTVFCLVYFIKSVLADRAREREDEDGVAGGRERGIIGWFKYYFNPIVCFALYFAFLLTLPFFGTLFGGTLLVFCLLSFLGGVSRRLLLIHATIAILSVGSMWALFTFGLRVLLPRGEIIPGI